VLNSKQRVQPPVWPLICVFARSQLEKSGGQATSRSGSLLPIF